MSDYRDQLDRERRKFAMRDGTLDGLQRRRDRKRRNGQIMAGIVALLIAAAGIGGGLFALRDAGKVPPAHQPTQSPSGPSSGPTAPSRPSGPIQFVDAEHGWVVDEKGQIRATSDGGRTWNVQLSGQSNIKAIEFVDRQHGWGVGQGGLIHTSDGGEHWVAWSNQSLSSIQFVDPTTGWGVTPPGEKLNGRLVKTSDGGRNWSQIPTPNQVESMCFANAGDIRTLWTVGNASDHQVLMKSLDDGQTWESSQVAVPPGEPWSPVLMCAGIDAWILDQDGGAAGHLPYVLFRTAEGGPGALEPVLQEAGTRPVGDAASIADAQDPYAGPFWAFDGVHALFVGWCPACGNSVSVYRSATGWQRRELVKADATPLGMSFVNDKRGWLLLQVGRSQIRVMTTSDGGVTWSIVS
jgi:photosystem II stability/assembly factor-like uncharacterized protein